MEDVGGSLGKLDMMVNHLRKSWETALVDINGSADRINILLGNLGSLRTPLSVSSPKKLAPSTSFPSTFSPSTAALKFWRTLLTFSEEGMYNEAYTLALEYNDDVLLQRLMSITGPCLHLLEDPLSIVLFAKVVKFLRTQQFVSLSLEWAQHAMEIEFCVTEQQKKTLLRLLEEISAGRTEYEPSVYEKAEKVRCMILEM